MTFRDGIAPVEPGEYCMTVSGETGPDYPQSLLFTIGPKDEFPVAYITIHQPELLALLETIVARLGLA